FHHPLFLLILSLHVALPILSAACSSSTRRVRASSSRLTANCSLRRMSLTVTVPLASSSSPSTSTKRMPERSACLNCLPSLPPSRSEEHTSELQSRFDLVCRL